MSSYFMSGNRMLVEFYREGNNPPRGYRGLHNFILSFPISYKIHKSDTHKEIFNLRTDVYLKNKLVGRAETEKLFHARSLGWDQDQWSNFDIILNKYDLEEIENLRNGSDVEFELKFKALSIEDGEEKITAHDNADLRYSIDQSHWLKLLDAWKYSENVLFEIHKSSDDLDLGNAFNVLKNAKELFYSGKWENSVTESRKVLDILIKKREFTKTFSDYVKTKIDNNYEDRMNLLILSLKQICDPSAHADPVSENIKWTRKEAELVLLQVAAILNSFSSDK